MGKCAVCKKESDTLCRCLIFPNPEGSECYSGGLCRRCDKKQSKESAVYLSKQRIKRICSAINRQSDTGCTCNLYWLKKEKRKLVIIRSGCNRTGGINVDTWGNYLFTCPVHGRITD